jgi:hypothetical protein
MTGGSDVVRVAGFPLRQRLAGLLVHTRLVALDHR